MQSENWRQCTDIFNAVLERPPNERARFLEQSCAGDDALRRRVEFLLRYHNQSDGFIESPAYETAPELLIDDTDAIVGQKLGHYQIDSVLGVGGMGVVYLAHDERLGRKVGLKLLPPSLAADEQQLEKLKREARTASALNHPNIVTIHDIGEVEGTYYIATEFIEGITLRERMSQGPIPPNEAIDIAIQLAGALSAAHAVGIVHRDIKPENIMLRHDGYVKILDFGIAKFTQPEAGQGTQTSTQHLIIGTARYMSPEQARGGPIDERTDIWSLGVVFYEMIAGRPPFAGETNTDVVAAVLKVEPPPVGLALPAGLHRVINRALAKNAEARYQNAADLRRELLAIQGKAGASRWRPRLAAVSLVILALAGGAYFKFAGKPAVSSASQIKSIAVLPLENLSGDPGQEYLVDGMTDALIGELARIRALRVISRTSSMHYKKSKKKLPEIASELNVDAVVEGTVLRDNDRVQVRTQLIHTPTDRHLWTQTFERQRQNLSGLQLEIAQVIAREVHANLTPGEQARVTSQPPIPAQAFDDYLQGRYLYWNKRTEENLHRAIEFFEKAIREHGSYALAYVGLADCYNSLGAVQFSGMPTIEAGKRAEAAARRALELDPDSAEAHGTLGYLHHFSWNWAAAEQEFRRAIELSPNHANAYNHYAVFLLSMGRVNEAFAASDRARELDPLSLSITVQRGFLSFTTRRYDEAIEQLERVIAVAPNHYQAHWHLALIHIKRERFDRAIAAAEKCVEVAGRTAPALAVLGQAHAAAGNREEALKILRELHELEARRYVTPIALMHVYIGLGDKDQAFASLEKAFSEHAHLIAYLQMTPVVDTLRSDPRMTNLVRRVGFPATAAGGATADSPASLRDKSIAVLPFADLSPGQDHQYLSDGMADEILSALAHVKDLKVAGRSSSFSFRDKNVDLPTIGAALGVAHILEGSVRKHGNKVRITAQLVQTSDGFHLWSETYDGALGDIFKLQERIARAITDQLKVVLRDEQKSQLVKQATTSTEAYNLFLQATSIFARRDGPRFADAEAQLQEALRLDPKFARAHARLAELYSIARAYDSPIVVSPTEAVTREAKLATELDPALAEPHAALGQMYFHERRYVEARAAYERALQLDPRDTITNFWLAALLNTTGYIKASAEMLDHLLARDPMMPNALLWRARTHLQLGEIDQAERTMHRAADAGLTSVGIGFAEVAHARGQKEELGKWLEKGLEIFLDGLPEDSSKVIAVGTIGDQKERMKAIALIDHYLGRQPDIISGGVPFALLWLGEPEHALAVAQGKPTRNDNLILCTLWTAAGRPARTSPRFPPSPSTLA